MFIESCVEKEGEGVGYVVLQLLEEKLPVFRVGESDGEE